MKVVVLTTSYPRDAGDVAGRFIADSVEGVRALGIEEGRAYVQPEHSAEVTAAALRAAYVAALAS